MLWIFLIGGIQILGLGITLARLAYDEWRQAQQSRTTAAAMEDRRNDVEYRSWKTAAT